MKKLAVVLTSILVVGAVPNGVAQIGDQWEQATASAAFSERDNHTSVVFGDKMWVIGGRGSVGPGPPYYCSDVWSTTDGANWTLGTASAAFGKRVNHASVVYDNKMWVIGGWYHDGINAHWYGDVWYSADGSNWTLATASAAFGKRDELTSVVHDGKMWVMGGGYHDGTSWSLYRDAWYSADGINWILATANAGFAWRHQSVVYDNKIWVVSGMEDGIFRNDVWYSSDGANWTQATASAAFSERQYPSIVVYDNKMWVIGGYNTPDPHNDTWYSTDGVNWTEATGAAAFVPRSQHRSVVFRDKMWVIGGAVESPIYDLNDVWYSPPGPLPTPTTTPTCTSTATTTPTFTITPTYTITPTFTPDFAAPTFQVIAIYDPDASDIIKIKVIASEPLIGNALDKVIVVPHSSSHPEADITASMVYQGNNTWILEYPRSQGFGDIAAIYVTGTDLASNQATSDGSFEKEIKPSKQKAIVKNNVFDPTKGGKVTIQVQVDRLMKVKVSIYNTAGVLIKTLVDEVKTGTFDIAWAGVNANSSIVASGIYIVIIETDAWTETKKVVVKK